MKMGVLEKDKNQLYIMKKLKVNKLKQFFDAGKSIQFRIYDFIATFFDLYKNKDKIPKSK